MPRGNAAALAPYQFTKENPGKPKRRRGVYTTAERVVRTLDRVMARTKTKIGGKGTTDDDPCPSAMNRLFNHWCELFDNNPAGFVQTVAQPILGREALAKLVTEVMQGERGQSLTLIVQGFKPDELPQPAQLVASPHQEIIIEAADVPHTGNNGHGGAAHS